MKKIFLLTTLFICFLRFGYSQTDKTDSSFGTNGIVIGNFGKQYNYGGIAKKILSQTDGSSYTILDLSGKTLITKTLPGGFVDVNYGQKGFSSFSDISPASAALQQDGKIVVAGNTNNHFGVARYNANGTVDAGFSTEGIKSIDYENYSVASGVALQGDGKIVIAGSQGFDRENASFVIVRLNTDGSADTTFDKDGMQGYYYYEAANSIVIQKDKKMVVSVFHYYDHNDFALLRYNTNGSLDSSFSGDGIQTTSFTDENGNSLESVISSTIIQTDGKIIATGRLLINNQYFVCLARYNTDGNPDSSFSNDGKQTTNLGAYASSIAIQDNGKIVVSGDTSLSRYNTNGSLDSTFNKNGILTSDFQLASIVTQNGKKILAAGNTFNDDNFVLARFNNNGSPDNTFNNDGKFVNAFKDRNTVYTNTAIQKDKKVVSVGRTWNGSNFDFIISRYNFDGSTDNTFHSNGKQTLDFSSMDDYADAAAIQDDGKIVVAGHSVKNDSSSFSVARYNTDGSLDITFSGDGLINLSLTNNANTTGTVMIQKDGKILVAGSALIRFNTDGSLDNTFNHNGKLNPPFATNGAVIQSDGKIVVAGSYNNNFAVARFNTNGSIDSSFSGNGRQTRTFRDYYDYPNPSVAYSVAIQNDGKIIAGGHCDCQDRFTGYSAAVVSRFNTDGSFDNTFSAFDEQGFDYSGFANSIAIQNDGKIIIADIPDNRVQRLNEDGSTDPNFAALRSDYNINSLKIVNKNLYTTGYTTPVIRGVTARFFYNDSSNPAPVVSITAPTNNAIFHLGQYIKIKASASDSGGTINKVEFYNGNILVHTETVAPYAASFKPLYIFDYTLTTKAYDNTGLITTSAPVHISVVSNKSPVVSIIKPVNNQSYTAPAYIHFEAAASDADGKIMTVEFYNGSVLLGTEYKSPYTFAWKNIPAGTYTITAVARDNWGAQTVSEPIKVKVISDSAIVSSKPYSENEKTASNDALSLRLNPNPATNIINIYTKGLQVNKSATISIISVSGMVLKTMRISNSSTSLDVSTLPGGVYTMKIISGDKVLYKQFVKL